MSLFTQMKGLHLGSCFALFVCSSSSHSLFGSQWYNLAGCTAWTPVSAGLLQQGKWEGKLLQEGCVWGMVFRWHHETMKPEGSCLLGHDPFPWMVKIECLWEDGLGGPAKSGRTRAETPISVPGLLYFLIIPDRKLVFPFCRWENEISKAYITC